MIFSDTQIVTDHDYMLNTKNFQLYTVKTKCMVNVTTMQVVIFVANFCDGHYNNFATIVTTKVVTFTVLFLQ